MFLGGLLLFVESNTPAKEFVGFANALAVMKSKLLETTLEVERQFPVDATPQNLPAAAALFMAEQIPLNTKAGPQ